MQHREGTFLQIDEPEFKFPIELNKKLSSSIILKNITSTLIAFRVSLQSPRKNIYFADPVMGLIPPGISNFEISVSRGELREAPPDMITSDMFVLKCVKLDHIPDMINSDICALEWAVARGVHHASWDMFDRMPSQTYHIGVSYYHLPVQDTSPKVSSLDSVIQSVSFFPSDLPARGSERHMVGSEGGARARKLLGEVVSEAVPVMAQLFQELPDETIQLTNGYLERLIGVPEKSEELSSFQRRLERRSDITFESLMKAHKAQLVILVAIKTGQAIYLSEKPRILVNELVEIFLALRCPNVNCKGLLPVDDCDCKMCSATKGFCSACMCPVCLKFGCANKTCSWVDCHVCSHWCHTVCGIQKNLIKPSMKGPSGTTEMHFHCPGCDHASEMFGFVKDVFVYCAEEWSVEILLRELDYVRKIFRGGEDSKGKELHNRAEQMLGKLENKLVSPSEACNCILQFFKCSESIRRFLRELESDKLMFFTHEDLGSFTSNFAPENKIGFGGFAVLYKGRFPNGVPIAVKVLRENDVTEQTFMAEVSTMAKTHHRNLVKLYGYCFQNEKKAMVYEYMENGSLDNVLFNNHLNLAWEKLYVIAIETAKGLSYLHDGCTEQIIHYDVKPGNVLLDSHHSPKLTDFGIAKLMNRDITHATLTGIRGTAGYTAPEVWMPASAVTYKCDVYSFGMMLFEVLGRSKNERKDNWFPKQVWEKFENGQLSQLIKDCGIGEKDREEADILSTVALWCAQFEPTKRPGMSTVVKMLEKEIPVSKPPNPFPF